jgi:hypothetical protein
MMDNYEKISIIEKIIKPYFKFEMDDFYGDRGGAPYPKIENLTRFYFKKNGRDRKLVLTKEEQQIMLDKIKKLNIGSVEIIKFPFIGIYICVDLYDNNETK